MVNFSRGHLGKADQYPMNKEFLEILIGLWDTYEDDAFIRDKENGIFLNHHKMHNVNYRGAYFSVDGPLNLSRSEEHTSELQSLMRISYAVFCLKKQKTPN